MVSTSAATNAAANGAPSENHIGGGTATAGRHHHASSAPAAPPHRNSATDPHSDFSRFHGMRRRPKRRPSTHDMPSPAAMMTHADAAMSGRRGNASTSNSTASG